MKRSEIHTAAIHEYHIHTIYFTSIKDAAKFFGFSVVTCGDVFRGYRPPNEAMLAMIGLSGFKGKVYTAAIHRFEVHHKSFKSLTKASDYFDMTTDMCGHIFRGAYLPSWLMINKLGIKHMIER